MAKYSFNILPQYTITVMRYSIDKTIEVRGRRRVNQGGETLFMRHSASADHLMYAEIMKRLCDGVQGQPRECAMFSLWVNVPSHMYCVSENDLYDFYRSDIVRNVSRASNNTFSDIQLTSILRPEFLHSCIDNNTLSANTSVFFNIFVYTTVRNFSTFSFQQIISNFVFWVTPAPYAWPDHTEVSSNVSGVLSGLSSQQGTALFVYFVPPLCVLVVCLSAVCIYRTNSYSRH